MDDINLSRLEVSERIIVTTTSKLIHFLRSLEDTGILPADKASNLIGSVKKLASVARGEVEDSE